MYPPLVITLVAVSLALATAWYLTYAWSTRKLAKAGSFAAMLSEKSLSLEFRLSELVEELKRRASWLDHQDEEIKWLQKELQSRPRLARQTYKILTLGVKGTGKTSLTLKWANPLTDLGMIEGTKIERYERTVSHILDNDVMTEHVFRIGDWGGEQIVEAQHELIKDEIHGLLIVVDLGGEGARCVQPERVQEQIREFEPQALRFLFGPTMVASCKAVVLFINKSDLIPGTPAAAEAAAKQHFSPLIESLMRYAPQVDMSVIVGSASSGHGTHHLWCHFVEKILPRSAYDEQLVQRMKRNSGGPRSDQGEGV